MTCCSVNDWVIWSHRQSEVVSHNWRQKRKERESGWKSIRWNRCQIWHFEPYITIVHLTDTTNWSVFSCCIGNQVEASCKREETKNFRGENREERDFQREREERNKRERERACRRRKLRFFHYFSSLIFLPLLPFPFFILSLISFLFPLSVTPL